MLRDLVVNYKTVDAPIEKASFISSFGTPCALSVSFTGVSFRMERAEKEMTVTFATKEEVQQLIDILSNMKQQMIT